MLSWEWTWCAVMVVDTIAPTGCQSISGLTISLQLILLVLRGAGVSMHSSRSGARRGGGEHSQISSRDCRVATNVCSKSRVCSQWAILGTSVPVFFAEAVAKPAGSLCVAGRSLTNPLELRDQDQIRACRALVQLSLVDCFLSTSSPSAEG